jgi:hypothetical protein
MQVYAVWAYEQYYPMGPGDLKGLYTNREDAVARMEELEADREGRVWGRPDYVRMTTETVQ